MENNNVLATINDQQASVMASLAKLRFGQNTVLGNENVITNEDGTTSYAVVTKDKDGAEITKVFTPATEKAKAVLAMGNALKTWGNAEGIIKAFLMSEFKAGLWQDMGYKSFLEGAAHQCGIGANSANQYARVGRIFIVGTVDEDGNITADWAEAWASEFKVSNLFQCLSVIKAIEDGMEDPTPEKVRKVFYDEYIKTDKLHPSRDQNTIKADMKKLSGKSEGKKTTKQEDPKQDAPKPEAVTVERAIAVLTEAVLERIPADKSAPYMEVLQLLTDALTEKPEEPKPEEPKQEEPKQEEPKQEEPKQEEPKQEEPKQDKKQDKKRK